MNNITELGKESEKMDIELKDRAHANNEDWEMSGGMSNTQPKDIIEEEVIRSGRVKLRVDDNKSEDRSKTLDNADLAEKNNPTTKEEVGETDLPGKRQRGEKLKQLWRQALARMLKNNGDEVLNPSDQELGTWTLGVKFWDAVFKQQLLEEGFGEEYPLGSSFDILGFDELLSYLRSEFSGFNSLKT